MLEDDSDSFEEWPTAKIMKYREIELGSELINEQTAPLVNISELMTSSHLTVKGYKDSGKIEQYHSALQITVETTAFIFILDEDAGKDA